MSNESFEFVFSDWRRRADFLNRQLAPIVNVEIDINTPDWEEQLASAPHPADESRLRKLIESLFNEIVAKFEFYEPDQRQQIIDLMGQNDALMYSAVIDADRSTPDGFRKNLLLFTIDDQGKDTRDAIVALTCYREEAEKHGVDADSIFKEMAALSSTRDKYGWGSTRDLFLKY